MTPSNKAVAKTFVPETLLYGTFAIGFCFLTARFLGKPLVVLFYHHPVGYGFLALGLMVFQGFVLERITHALCSLLRGGRKASR